MLFEKPVNQRIFRKTRKPPFKQNPRKTTISGIDSRDVFHQLKHISSSFVDTRRTVELDWVRYMSSVWLFLLTVCAFLNMLIAFHLFRNRKKGDLFTYSCHS